MLTINLQAYTQTIELHTDLFQKLNNYNKIHNAADTYEVYSTQEAYSPHTPPPLTQYALHPQPHTQGSHPRKVHSKDRVTLELEKGKSPENVAT